MFIALWTLCSSLCTLVAAIIAKQSFGTGSTRFVEIGLVVYWILLGLVQWQLLKPYITDAYNWGLTTIIGGIGCSFLMGLGFFLAFYFWIRNSNITNFLGGRNSNPADWWIALVLIIVSLFASGFILGWMQKLIIQHSVNSVYITYLPIVNGLTWLLCLPLFIILYFSFARDSFYFYIVSMYLSAAFFSLFKGWTIKLILNI